MDSLGRSVSNIIQVIVRSASADISVDVKLVDDQVRNQGCDVTLRRVAHCLGTAWSPCEARCIAARDDRGSKRLAIDRRSRFLPSRSSNSNHVATDSRRGTAWRSGLHLLLTLYVRVARSSMPKNTWNSILRPNGTSN